jgi:hypothetical protein
MTTKFATIDDVLGDAGSRYLGSGHSRVEYSLSNHRITYSAECSAAVGGSWSKKGNSEAEPHASSLDALALAVVMADRYCRDVLRYPAAKTESLLPHRVSIKAGGEPSALALMPITIDLDDADAATNAATLAFRAQVANLKNSSPASRTPHSSVSTPALLGRLRAYTRRPITRTLSICPSSFR